MHLVCSQTSQNPGDERGANQRNLHQKDMQCASYLNVPLVQLLHGREGQLRIQLFRHGFFHLFGLQSPRIGLLANVQVFLQGTPQLINCYYMSRFLNAPNLMAKSMEQNMIFAHCYVEQSSNKCQLLVQVLQLKYGVHPVAVAAVVAQDAVGYEVAHAPVSVHRRGKSGGGGCKLSNLGEGWG